MLTVEFTLAAMQWDNNESRKHCSLLGCDTFDISYYGTLAV